MNAMDYRVINIGTLSNHPLWQANQPRTAHATTTLIRSEDKTILVDPSLPAQALQARLEERSGLDFGQITHVFLTNFRPNHRRALDHLEHATWWISEAEREQVGKYLIERMGEADDAETQAMYRVEIEMMKRCQSAPDKLADQVDLFPLPGYTPGNAGLLLTLTNATVLIAGDAVATVEHMEKGQVLSGAYDIEQARESLVEAIEIADWIIPGHDNLVPNMTRRMF